MLFTYAGSFADNYPTDIFRIFGELATEIPGFRDDVLVRIFGKLSPAKRREIENFNLGRMLEIKGHIPPGEVPSRVMDSDVLLLILPQTGAYRKVYTLKVFTYLGARRIIIAAMQRESLIGDLLRRTGAGFCADPGEPEQSKALIASLYKKFKENGRLVPEINESAIREYDVRNLTGRLAAIIDGLTAGKKEDGKWKKW
jgi:hypothetical protein